MPPAIGYSCSLLPLPACVGVELIALRRCDLDLSAQVVHVYRRLAQTGMGHGPMRAALIYQHATRERDRQVADRLSVLVESSRAVPDGMAQ